MFLFKNKSTFAYDQLKKQIHTKISLYSSKIETTSINGTTFICDV